MPLAVQGCGVTLLLEHAADRQPVLFNQTRPTRTGEHAPHSVSKCHAPGENAVSGRRADG